MGKEKSRGTREKKKAPKTAAKKGKKASKADRPGSGPPGLQVR